jgi:hypothetical protein
MTMKKNISENDNKKLPKQAREFSAFINLVCEAATGDFPNDQVRTDIRCFKKGCFGTIDTILDFENNTIHWQCTTCPNNGELRDSLWSK